MDFMNKVRGNFNSMLSSVIASSSSMLNNLLCELGSRN